MGMTLMRDKFRCPRELRHRFDMRASYPRISRYGGMWCAEVWCADYYAYQLFGTYEEAVKRALIWYRDPCLIIPEWKGAPPREGDGA